MSGKTWTCQRSQESDDITNVYIHIGIKEHKTDDNMKLVNMNKSKVNHYPNFCAMGTISVA